MITYRQASALTRKRSYNHKIIHSRFFSTILDPQESKIPPRFLSPTASQHAFIATCALEENNITGHDLFQYKTVPKQFRGNKFEYIPPIQMEKFHTVPKPEVAFLGRSNVGKSSLINALTKIKIAKVSKTPGRTQTVNHFALINSFDKHCKNNISIDHINGYFIDLPGYGYAKAKKESIQAWQERTQNFLLQRRDTGTLKRLYFLIDPRHDIHQFDRVVMGWFDEANIPYSVVLTKCDKVPLKQIVKISNEVCMRFHSQFYLECNAHLESCPQHPIVHNLSSKSGAGIVQFLWTVADDLWGDANQD